MTSTTIILISTMLLIVASLIISLNNYIRFKGLKNKEKAIVSSIVGGESGYIKKGYAYSVDVGDAMVFVAVIEKKPSDSLLNILPQEIQVKVSDSFE
ncbi:MAG: hypothetical protein QW632_01670 [Ignisphaera sp.]